MHNARAENTLDLSDEQENEKWNNKRETEIEQMVKRIENDRVEWPIVTIFNTKKNHSAGPRRIFITAAARCACA